MAELPTEIADALDHLAGEGGGDLSDLTNMSELQQFLTKSAEADLAEFRSQGIGPQSSPELADFVTGELNDFTKQNFARELMGRFDAIVAYDEQVEAGGVYVDAAAKVIETVFGISPLDIQKCGAIPNPSGNVSIECHDGGIVTGDELPPPATAPRVGGADAPWKTDKGQSL